MVPNGTAYASFPDFANNGNKTPPGGRTDSAKYAQGMLPADTFPAEWANYLFHGATAGITRLNTDTLSIKEEINTVLSSRDENPDATKTNQLLTVLNKIKAEAILAAHPVGSLYWTASTENPAVTFGGGTWTQIKDKFILAAGDTYTNGDTGGAATVTLTTENLPSHSHSFSGTTGDNNRGHTHSGTTGSMNRNWWHNHTMHSFWANGNGVVHIGNNYGMTWNSRSGEWREYSYSEDEQAPATKPVDVNHEHSFTTGDISQNHTHSYSGTTGTTGSGTAFSKLPPYAVKYCWQRTA